MAEIDEIFSSKGKRPITDLPNSAIPKNSKRKKSKAFIGSSDPLISKDSTMDSNSKKRREPETILDISSDLRPLSKRRRKRNNGLNAKLSNSANKSLGDCRSTKDRRLTEEGWAIFKENELGIDYLGGDTPSCPFDCDCCF